MNDLLTEQETEALLEGIEDGSVSTDTGMRPRGQVVPIDYAAYDHLVTGQWPVLERINERLATRLSESLKSVFPALGAVRFAGLYRESYLDYTSGLSVPSAIHVLDLSPLPGKALMVMDTAFLYLGVDSRFGGPCRPPVLSQQRAFTRSERLLLQTCQELILSDLSKTWEEVEPIEVSVESLEFDARYLEMMPSSTMLLASRFEVEFASQKATINIVIPHATMQPIEARLTGTEYRPDDHVEEWREALRETLLDVELDVQVSLAEVPASFRDMIDMQSGDVMEVEFDQTVTAVSGEQPLFIGRIGTSRERKAMMLSAVADRTALPKTTRRALER
ncbi:MAG: FliM/FliN family flagellar motor switch protein [Pseudomonadota bacterium]